MKARLAIPCQTLHSREYYVTLKLPMQLGRHDQMYKGKHLNYSSVCGGTENIYVGVINVAESQRQE